MSASKNRKPKLRCIVKLGGAAITQKSELESINEDSLGAVCGQLRHAMASSTISMADKITRMDWSRRGGARLVEDLDENNSWESGVDTNFVVVHGAGSFGHFQASKSGVHKGKLELPIVKAGFVATRISVTSLNLEIVRALARGTHTQANIMILFPDIIISYIAEGIPAVGMSPFACGWSTQERKFADADISQIKDALQAGFVPVLHGDAVLDRIQGCTILSGDAIIRHLADLLLPDYVVFLTDVLGVYDRPPTDPNATLLREIAVGEGGDWSVVNPMLDNTEGQVKISVAAHDTTGGMEAKILEAAMIAKLGIDVYITKAGTTHCQRALKGEVQNAPEDWLGTIVRSSGKK